MRNPFPSHEADRDTNWLRSKDQIGKSKCFEFVAEALTILNEGNQATAIAELCEQPIDRLAACTAIVREHSITHNPALAELFRKAIE